jgi:3-phenylpropionate/cinnamic acid dioxygenase small subunit
VSWQSKDGDRALDSVHPDETRLLREATALLSLEVDLLDDRDYSRWLDLYADVCLYWMPVDQAATDGSLRLNVFYDDRARMQDRVNRLLSSTAFSGQPPTLTSRTLSILKVELDKDKETVIVKSNFTLVAYRQNRQRVFGGRYLHRLVRLGGVFRVTEKRIGLLGSDAPQHSMTFLF